MRCTIIGLANRLTLQPMPQRPTPSTHKFLKNRAIVIGLPIDDALAADFSNALSQLTAASSNPITLYVNSPGGAVFASERIMRTIENSGLELRTCCMGLAAGSAVHIFLLGSHRSALADAILTFNDFKASDGTPLLNLQLRQLCIDRTSQSLGTSPATINQWMLEERSFSGQELVKAKLVHSIL